MDDVTRAKALDAKKKTGSEMSSQAALPVQPSMMFQDKPYGVSTEQNSVEGKKISYSAINRDKVESRPTSKKEYGQSKEEVKVK